MDPVIVVDQLSRVVRERGALFRKPKMKTILHEASLKIGSQRFYII